MAKINFKLEPGKYYRTRDGRKAFVGFRRDIHSFPCVGHIENRIEGWTDKGGYTNDFNEHHLDLIEEWKEPEVHEVECVWKKRELTGEVFPCQIPDSFLIEWDTLVGKRTKVRIEVKE